MDQEAGIEQIKHLVIMVTVSDKAEGAKVARPLVEEGLAACVNIVEGLTSVFMWKGKVEEETEALLIIKTTTERLYELIGRVKELHSYDVPEVIALPIVDGNPAFLQWIEEVT